MRHLAAFVLIWCVLGLLAVVPPPGRPAPKPLHFALLVAIVGGPFLFCLGIYAGWVAYRNGRR